MRRAPARCLPRVAALVTLAASLLAVTASSPAGHANVAAAAATNPIVLENQQPGTDAWRIGRSGHGISDDATGQIKGYASATSVDKGDEITFKVSVNHPQTYTIDLYRMGCYPDSGGVCLGGRLMQSLGPFDGVTQPACTLDGPGGGNTGLLECNWSGPTFRIPTTWTSGIYLGVLTNADSFQNYVTFVVRDDHRQAAFLYQQPVMNYQGYNPYPYFGGGDTRNGKSLYDNASGGADT